MNGQTKTTITTKQVLNYFWGIGIKHRFAAIMLIIMRTINTIIPLIIPIYLKSIIDIVSQGGDVTGGVIDQVMHYVIIVIILEIVKEMAWRVFERYIVHFELAGMEDIYNECFLGMHHRAYRFFINSFGGTLVKRVNKLVRGFERTVDMMIFAVYPLIITMTVMFFIIFQQDSLLGRIFFGWIGVFLLVQIPLYKWKMKYELEAHAIDSKTTGLLADTITNHNTIAVFGSLSREHKLFRDQIADWKRVNGTNRIKGNYVTAINGFLIIGFLAVMLVTSVNLWGSGIITVGTIVMLLLYLYRIIQRILDIGNVFKRLSNAIGEAAEMIEILYAKKEIEDKPEAEEMVVSQGAISFDKVNFSYDGNRTIFGGLDITIKPGEKVALVGQSGAGKSSITKLLLRYFDIQGGSISIDGVDIRDVTQESLRASLSLVPQEPILFHRSLRENIAYGNPDATEEEIIAASMIARCHEFILNLEDGYDTMVGERGVKLSGGERQRVAIARAILEDKKILILDEATSSLDSESEKMIQDAIQELMKNKTALVIAHRLSTIKEMDRILVFDQGRVIEQGTHEDLLNITDGIYKKLWTIQAT